MAAPTELAPSRKRRANGNGTVYQRSDGRWVARAYVLMPDGTTARRDYYATSEKAANRKLVEAMSRSHQGIPAEATGWTVERFLLYWLEHVVRPARKPKTHQGYGVVVRVHLIPQLGRKKLHRLTGVDVRQFLARLRNTCLCCLHGVDGRRPVGERKCCAIGRCCERVPSARLVQQVHSVLRNALQAAVGEELPARKVAKLVQVSAPTYEVNRGVGVAEARACSRCARSLQRVDGHLQAVTPGAEPRDGRCRWSGSA
ncbi:tyrosine-type recombinase/integrase [Actinopolymorpha singaporensis]